MDYYDPTGWRLLRPPDDRRAMEEPAGFREEADAAEPDEAEPDAAEDVGGGEAEDALETPKRRLDDGRGQGAGHVLVPQAADGALGPARPDHARDAQAAGRVAGRRALAEAAAPIPTV